MAKEPRRCSRGMRRHYPCGWANEQREREPGAHDGGRPGVTKRGRAHPRGRLIRSAVPRVPVGGRAIADRSYHPCQSPLSSSAALTRGRAPLAAGRAAASGQRAGVLPLARGAHPGARGIPDRRTISAAGAYRRRRPEGAPAGRAGTLVQVLFQRGDEPDGLYVIASGRVRVAIAAPDGDDLTLATFGPGEVLRELSA